MDETFGVLETENVFLCGRDVNVGAQKSDCGCQLPRWPQRSPLGIYVLE